MFPTSSRLLSVSVAAALLAACGGGGSSGGSSSMLNSTPQSGNVAMLLSDASSEDWATIGVKVLSIALVPQGGGSNVTVYTAPIAGADREPRAARSDRRAPRQFDRSRRHVHRCGADRQRQCRRHTAHGIAGSGGRICRGAGHHHSCESDPGSAHPGERLQPHGTGEGHVRFAAGREREPEQRARPRIRSGASCLPRRPRTGGNGRHHLGGQFQRTGASPSAARPRSTRAASYLRRRERDFLGQQFDHDHQGIPGRAPRQPGDGRCRHAVPADPRRRHQRHPLL